MRHPLLILLAAVCGAVLVSCDGQLDGDLASADADSDGYGSAIDCDDQDPDVHPRADELCNDVDDDCDGDVDEDPVDGDPHFADEDGDGAFGTPVLACAASEVFGAEQTDCDDADATIHPGALEACNGVDDDCDGALPEVEEDGDEDGFIGCAECDDGEALANPEQRELCDGLDNDCDGDVDEEGDFFEDEDGDGFGDPWSAPVVASCAAPPDGLVPNNEDCDDSRADMNPDATEVCDDANRDEDCDGEADNDDASADEDTESSWYRDIDGDGFGNHDWEWSRCDPPTGYVGDDTDCDDGAAAANPGITTETCGDGLDNDCDGSPGSCGGPVGVVRLEDAEAKLTGESSGNAAGRSVRIAGDINNDGYDDILVGSPLSSAGSAEAGATYLILGPGLEDSNLADADARLIGEGAGDFAGKSVAGAGDVNDDGYDDILVGAWGRGYQDVGAAYLFLGPVSDDVGLEDADAKLVGEVNGDHAGAWVSAAGDVNDDGFADILVGAPGNSQGGASAGAAYLMLGPISGQIDLADADAKFVGESGGDQAGWAVAGAGDFNGDGVDDLVVGAPSSNLGGTDSGAVYVLFGPVTGTVDLSDAELTFVGEADHDRAGYSVAGAGDVNADGYDDLIVGAHSNDEGAPGAGAAYLILGPASGYFNLSSADAKLTGVMGGDTAGQQVDAAGDVNADGYDDLLIAAPNSDNGGSRSGTVYLVLGPVDDDMELRDADARLFGEGADDFAGVSAARGGHIDNDGYDDLVIGATGDDAGGSNAGAAYLVVGGPGL